MKRAAIIFLFAIPVLNTAAVFARSAAADTLEYKRFYYDNGQVSSEGYWKNNGPEGEWKNYDPQGNLVSCGARKNMKLEGVWTFYQNNKISSQISYQNNRKNGQQISYSPNRITRCIYINDTLQGIRTITDSAGNLLQTTPFVNGVENGMERKYNAYGDADVFVFYKNGLVAFRQQANYRDEQAKKQGVWKDYYNNGNLQWECGYKDNLKNGYYKTYDSTGNLLSMEKYVDDVLQEEAPETAELSVRTEYYANGQPKFRVTCKDGIPNGLCRQYDSLTGKVIRGIVFKDGKPVGTEQLDAQGNKSEEHKEYYPDGTLKCEGRILKGKKYGYWKFYYPDGTLQQEGEYRAGRYEGEWRWYFPDGKLRLQQEYYRGKEDGMSTEYNDSARIVAQGRYTEGLEEGLWTYCRHGETTEGRYSAGEKDGVWKSWWNSGKNKKLSFQGRYESGIADGFHQWFYPDGTVKEDGYFRLGRRIGTWTKYTPDGTPEIRIKYDPQTEEEIRYNGRKTL